MVDTKCTKYSFTNVYLLIQKGFCKYLKIQDILFVKTLVYVGMYN